MFRGQCIRDRARKEKQVICIFYRGHGGMVAPMSPLSPQPRPAGLYMEARLMAQQLLHLTGHIPEVAEALPAELEAP